VVVTLNITNAGGTDAQNVQLTVGKLNSTPGVYQSPSLGTVAKGTTVSTTLIFDSSMASGLAVLTVSGIYTGGSFSSASKVTVP